MDRARLSAALVALALPAGAAAAEGAARWYLQVDNDVVFGTDRWYTSGVRIARVADAVEWALVQEIYTPDAKHPAAVDRAPVGRLLVSAARHFESAAEFRTVELALGVRGPAALGRQSTEFVHRLIPAPEVDWSRQLDNRFDAQLSLAASHRFTDLLKAHCGVVAGADVVHAHAGLEVRIGADTQRSSPMLRFAATPLFGAGEVHGWSAYAGASARGVARNALLERNYDPEGPPLDRRRFVARFVAGVAWAAREAAVTFELVQDSREFDGQTAPHRFGSLALHYSF